MNPGKLSRLSRAWNETHNALACARRLGWSIDDVNAGLLLLAKSKKKKRRGVTVTKSGNFAVADLVKRPVTLPPIGFLDPARRLPCEVD